MLPDCYCMPSAIGAAHMPTAASLHYEYAIIVPNIYIDYF